jgi:hypothetical protein
LFETGCSAAIAPPEGAATVFRAVSDKLAEHIDELHVVSASAEALAEVDAATPQVEVVESAEPSVPPTTV